MEGKSSREQSSSDSGISDRESPLEEQAPPVEAIYDGETLAEECRQFDEEDSDDEFFGNATHSSSYDSHVHKKDWTVNKIRRVHFGGLANKVKPVENFLDYLSQVLMCNMDSMGLKIPFLAKYTVPLIIGAVDTMIITPPSEGNELLYLLPLIQQVQVFPPDPNARQRSPVAVIISSYAKVRRTIYDLAMALSTDLELFILHCTKNDHLEAELRSDRCNFKLDLLITDPKCFYKFFFSETNGRQNPLRTERLSYAVFAEGADIRDSCSLPGKLREQINQREFNLIVMSKMSHPSKTLTVASLLHKEAAIIATDSTVAIKHTVKEIPVGGDSQKRAILTKILQDRKTQYMVHEDSFVKNDNRKDPIRYDSTIVVFVSTPDRVKSLRALLCLEDTIFQPHEVVDLDKGGAFGALNRGEILVAISSRPHDTRIKKSVVDMVIFYDLWWGIHKLVLCVSKTVPDRRCLFLVDTSIKSNDTVDEKIVSLVQYLKDHYQPVPPIMNKVYERAKKKRVKDTLSVFRDY